MKKPTDEDHPLLVKVKVFSDRAMTRLVGIIDLSDSKQWKYFKGLLIDRDNNEEYEHDAVLSSYFPKTWWADPYTINKLMNDADPSTMC